MGLWFTSKKGIAVHEGGNLLNENPGILTWLKTHKAAIGDAFIITSATVATCGDPVCLKIAGPLLIVGGILKAAGVLPADADAKAKELGATIAADAPAIRDLARAVHDLIAPQLAVQLAVHKDETVKAAAAAAAVAMSTVDIRQVAQVLVNGTQGASS